MNNRVNANELKAQLARKDITQYQLAEEIGLSWTGFWKKITGQNSFTVDEVRAIRDVLELEDEAIKEIFLI